MSTPPSIPSHEKAPTPGIAKTSLVLGILSFLCFGPLTGIPAIITGHMARKRIRDSGGTLGGEGISLAGMITGYVNLGLFLTIVPLFAAIAIPNFVKARSTAQKNICVQNLQKLEAATDQWAIENQKEDGAEVTMADVAEFLEEPIGECPAKGTYSVGPVGELPKCSAKGHGLSEDSGEALENNASE